MQAVPSFRMQGGETSGGLRGKRDVPRMQLRGTLVEMLGIW